MKRDGLARFAMKATLGIAVAVVSAASMAQVYGTNSSGQTGFISTPQPTSPNCVAPNVWTPFNGHYMCAPPQPSCQYGFAYGPTWDGNQWVYACNAPPPPPPPPPTPPPPPQGGGTVTPDALCQQRAAQYGITIGPPGPVYGPTNGNVYQHNYYHGTGPVYNDGYNPPTTDYQTWCNFTEPDGNWAPAYTNPFMYAPIEPQCAGCGGGT